MAEKIKVYEESISSPEYATLGAYVDAFDSLAYEYKGTESVLLNVKGTDGITNKDRIFATYTKSELNRYKNASPRDLKLKIGTIIAVPCEKAARNALLTQGIQVVSNSIPAFKAQALVDIESDPGYITINRPIEGKQNLGTLKEIYPDMTVWMWCRSLSKNIDIDLKGQIFDLTPFIQNISTNVGKNGGNFSLTLPPLVCSLNESGTWIIKKK